MQMRDQREINADPATVYAALLAPQTISASAPAGADAGGRERRAG